MRTALRLSLIEAHEQAKGVLRAEQRQKLERLHDRMPGMMGSSSMGMMEAKPLLGVVEGLSRANAEVLCLA